MKSSVDDFGRAFATGRVTTGGIHEIGGAATPAPSPAFQGVKRVLDIAMALAMTPLVCAIGLALLLLNPIWNPGPLLFRQTRMGRDCRPFTAYKFRTMRCACSITRGPDDPVEEDRVTRLGRVLRRKHIDELPQVFNVLLGDMSMVGPRPDFWNHAIHYTTSIPGYRERHAVNPGITGLAQVNDGYAQGIEATFRKVAYDLDYIRHASLGTDLRVLLRTVKVFFCGVQSR